MKLKFKLISLLLIIMIFTAGLSGCGSVAYEYTYEYEYEYNYSTPETEWLDIGERPEIVPPVTFEYPSKPEQVPEDDGTGASISEWTAYGEYDIEETTGGAKIAYSELSDWSYVYAGINNYSYDRRNIRVDYIGSGADRITVQAIYYEMYDLDYVPVTIYMGSLKEEVGSFVVNFNSNTIPVLDNEFNVVEGSDLSDYTLIGLVMFIDSNPAQTEPFTDGGELEITNVRFLANGNSQLNVPRTPSVKRMIPRNSDAYELTYETGYGTATHTERLSAGEYLILPIIDWQPGDSTVIEIKIINSGFVAGTNANRFSEIKMAFKVPEMFESYWQSEAITTVSPNFYNIGNNVTETTLTIDFSATRPRSVLDGSVVDNFLIKNYPVTAVRIYYNSNISAGLTEGGQLTVTSAKFI